MKQILTLLVFSLCSTSAFALDNPDEPDYVGQFKAQATQYEQKIQQANTTAEFAQAYQKYEGFLDEQLNTAYGELVKQLNNQSKIELRNSQRNWLAYRSSEFKFIDHNWNNLNFGTSSQISRGDYKTSLIKARVILLLDYLKNY